MTKDEKLRHTLYKKHYGKKCKDKCEKCKETDKCDKIMEAFINS